MSQCKVSYQKKILRFRAKILYLGILRPQFGKTVVIDLSLKIHNLCMKNSLCEKLIERSLDYKLNFEKNIEDICKKASSQCTCKTCTMRHVLMTAFFKS